ncbi:MAG: hypothetical protein HOD92_16145 [Deltaproteobacteria bacterium]|nr:hypothetical protein [Deltaproteobacteria bacterium]
MEKKIIKTFIYLTVAGGLYYWLVVPTLLVFGNSLAERLSALIRFNIPQFFLGIFLVTLPIVWLLISKFENNNNGN